MEHKLDFRAARWGDCNAIAPRVRAIEAAECAASGSTPKASLRLGLRASAMVWTGTIDGRPEAMFGVAPMSVLAGEGRPWMLGTERAALAGRAFLTVAPEVLKVIERTFPRLENWVHRDNQASLRWLQRLGFTIDEEVETFRGVPMRRFSRGY